MSSSHKKRARSEGTSDRVFLNVGGEVFQTTISTLTANSQFFSRKFSSEWSTEDTEDEIFLDRDADSFRVLDGRGAGLELGGVAGFRTSGRLFAGRSGLLSVPAGAETIVLFRDGAEVGRQPFEATPGGVTNVAPGASTTPRAQH